MCFLIFEDIFDQFFVLWKTKIWVHWNEMLRSINYFHFELNRGNLDINKIRLKADIYKNLLADHYYRCRSYFNFKILMKLSLYSVTQITL